VPGPEVRIGVAKQSFGRSDELGIVGAEAENAALVWRGGHGVDVRVIGKTGVSVMVIEGDGVDFL
jgi:hypothetical protein